MTSPATPTARVEICNVLRPPAQLKLVPPHHSTAMSPNAQTYSPQPSIEAESQPQALATQPTANARMEMKNPGDARSKQDQEVMRLRGGCPGHFCGLPILPCRCDICIIPIPCC